MSKPAALIFDVNETMLDLSAMKPIFADQVGDDSLVSTWFSLLLRYSLEVTVIGHHLPFDQIARNALAVVAEQAGLNTSAEAIQTVVEAMENLPAHPDVAPALERLTEAGFKLATLSNSSLEAVTAQLTNAGLIQYFTWTLSVDAVQRFKPDPRTYHFAADPPSDLMLVAAHDWDVNGAHLAGMQAAFVERASATRAPHAVLPELRRPTMTGIADALLKEDS